MKTSKVLALREMREKSFTEPETGLVIYNSMVNAIEKCHRVDEVKEIRDKAFALEQYARQAQNIEAEKKAIEIRLRAERRAGELLKGMERGKGPGRGKKNSHGAKSFSEYAKAQKDAKISKDQASRWQKLADIPPAKFEGRLTEMAGRPSTTGMIGGGIPLTDRSTWLLGRLRDFKRRGFFEARLSDVLEEMPDSFRKEAGELIDQLRIWLGGSE